MLNYAFHIHNAIYTHYWLQKQLASNIETTVKMRSVFVGNKLKLFAKNMTGKVGFHWYSSGCMP